MDKPSFENLCSRIGNAVGDEIFLSESYLAARAHPRTHEATKTAGGVVPGEVKVALTLRILAGSSYLDLILVYFVGKATIYDSFHDTVDWINDAFGDFPLRALLEGKNVNALKKIADGFSQFSNGNFYGCIGALDGIAIRIKCPVLSGDIPDPGNYFCRKHFYALNVQAIVDSKKHFIWVSTGHQGSTHDSVAFGGTELCSLMVLISSWLLEQGFFLIGDSAFNLASWMITPYEDASFEGDIKDVFNFWHSNS